MNEKILIIDDEKGILNSLASIFEDENMVAVTAETAEEAMQILKKNGEDFDAVLLDIWLPKMDGLEFLEWIKKNHEKLPVVMMSGHGNIETAVKATKYGAYDFIEKPLSLENVLLTIAHAVKESRLEKENEELKQRIPEQSYEIIGESSVIEELREQIKLAAPSDAWVLIHGENGTGKELVARQIHMQSLRKDKNIVEVNCAAIPEELIESELFGHEKGSFTGAISKKRGKFDMANGSTLFLDEIADMSLKTQATILRILQEQRFERVGGTEVIEVDVRIIAASNKNLEEEIAAGKFREDLYYRLNVIPLEIPPLRERGEDIPLLINHFLTLFAKEERYPKKKISPEAMKILVNYHWPGNIRELKNIVERMVIMVRDEEIKTHHIPPAVRMVNPGMFSVEQFPKTIKEARDAFESEFIRTMLEKNSWNISRTAEMIQLERSNLHKKIKQLKIEIP